MATILTSAAVLLRILSNPLANVYQKQLTAKGDHPLLVNFLTYLMLSVICLFLAVFMNWYPLPGVFWMYSILGGMAGATGNGFLVKALQKGDLSVLGPVNSYKSVVGILGGMVLLGEFPNAWGALGMALIVFGSYFVLDTTEERFSWTLLKKTEIRYRIWAMVLTAIEAVFIKKIILASSPAMAFISWCWFGALFSFVLLFLYPVDVKQGIVNTGRREAGKYGLLVLCIGIMQFTTNYVFDHMEVGYALALFQLSTIVSVLMGYRYFQERDIGKKLVGTLIMIAGSIVVILLKDR